MIRPTDGPWKRSRTRRCCGSISRLRSPIARSCLPSEAAPARWIGCSRSPACAGWICIATVRLNLGPDGIAGQATVPATETLTSMGRCVPGRRRKSRAFQVEREGDRQVAESLEMAEAHGDAC
jgi:hypothetical protein